MECLTDSQTKTNEKQHENDETWILLFLILVSHTNKHATNFFGRKWKMAESPEIPLLLWLKWNWTCVCVYVYAYS